MFLQEVDGHEKIIEGFRSALINGHVAHAYLFSGPEGAGKKRAAYGLAASLLCSNQKNGYACGVCKDCIQYRSGNHPDFLELAPKDSSVKIEQIRDMQKKMGYKAYQGSFRVCIINNADAMTTQAANCLLKTLEEPAGKVVFILLASNPCALLPTVLSRCQKVHFEGALPAEKKEYLNEVLMMLKLMQKAAGLLEAIKLAEKYAKLNKEDICRHLEVMSLFFRDLLVWKETGEVCLLINPDLIGEFKRLSQIYSVTRLVKLIEEIKFTAGQIESSANARLALELLFLSLFHSRRF